MMAWHYTTGNKIASILKMGVLLPATAGVHPPEKPVVWFSLHPQWEPTASKGLVDERGLQRAATLAEMLTITGGLYRFGIDARGLLCGEALKRHARINRRTWAALCAAGYGSGANPNEWFGHVGQISIDRLVLQRLPAVGGEWTNEMAEVTA